VLQGSTEQRICAVQLQRSGAPVMMLMIMAMRHRLVQQFCTHSASCTPSTCSQQQQSLSVQPEHIEGQDIEQQLNAYSNANDN
jgi:hypothetical protein